MAESIKNINIYKYSYKARMLEKLNGNFDFIESIDLEDLRDDEEFMLGAIGISHSFYNYASDRLKGEKNFTIRAIEIGGVWTVFPKIPNKLKLNKDVVLVAISQDVWILKHEVPMEMRNNKDIALVAVKKDGAILEYLSPEMQDDKDVVIEAVKQRGSGVLKYASEKLQHDDDILDLAKQSDQIYRDNLEATIKSMDARQKFLQEERKRLLEEEKKAKENKKLHEQRISNRKETILSELEIDEEQRELLERMRYDYYLIQTLDTKFRGNKDFMLRAIKITEENFQYASKQLRYDKDFVIKAIIINPYVSEYLSNSFIIPDEIKNSLLDEIRKDEDVFLLMNEKENKDY